MPSPTREPPAVDLEAEFSRVYLEYRRYCRDVNYRELFPDANLPSTGQLDPLDHLATVDVGKIIQAMIAVDVDRSKSPTFGRM